MLIKIHDGSAFQSITQGDRLKKDSGEKRVIRSLKFHTQRECFIEIILSINKIILIYKLAWILTYKYIYRMYLTTYLISYKNIPISRYSQKIKSIITLFYISQNNIRAKQINRNTKNIRQSTALNTNRTLH